MIVFQDVTKKYGDDKTVLDKVNFEIDKGAFAYLVGPTGSGKTTIFRLLIKDLSPTSGSINIGDWNITTLPGGKVSELRRKVGVIFQDLKLLMDRTVMENVLLPLQMSGTASNEAKRRSEEALIEVGLEGKEDQFPLQLSGGERQRVAIARALVFEPEVLLADEPTGNLDNETTKQIHEVLKKINKRGTTIFMATHNDRLLDRSEDRIIVLEKGKIAEDRKGKAQANAHTNVHAKHNEEEKKEKDDEKEEKSEKLNLEDLAAKEDKK